MPGNSDPLASRFLNASGVSAIKPDATRERPPSGVSENIDVIDGPPKLKSICRDGVDVTSNGASSMRGVVKRWSGAGVDGVGPGAASSLYGHMSPP
jgi:hypothetical protein